MRKGCDMGKQNKKRNNHYLPICYQKPFSDGDGLVWVQFLDQDTPPRHLNPKSVGAIYKFYTRYVNGVEDDSIENFFHKFVEDFYAPIARRVQDEMDKFVLTRDDVPVLLRFVSSQVVRTEAHRQCIQTQAGGVIAPDVFHHNLSRKMGLITEAWIQRPPDIHLRTSLPYVGSHYVTGDSPVITFAVKDDQETGEIPAILDIQETLANSKSGFSVPLSPYVRVIVLNGGSGEVKSKAESETPDVVSKMNDLTYGQCVQFVESMDEKSLIYYRQRRERN
jgi:hypothetical protein